jgi:hypothetical protein
MKYRIHIQEYRTVYSADVKDRQSTEEYVTTDECETVDAKTGAAILRGIADRLDPPKVETRY